MPRRRIKEVVPAEPVLATEEEAKPVLRTYHITLKYSPDRVIEAESPEEAWAKYRRLLGIIESQHQPVIKEDDGQH